MVTLRVKNLEKLDALFASIGNGVEGTIEVQGPAAAYWMVWEYGSARLVKPGPKTMWSTNAYGKRAILTKTAPHGYIRINQDKYIEYMKEEMSRLDLGKWPMEKWMFAIRQAANLAGARIVELIRQTAPVDTGQLQNNIVVKPE